MTLEDQPRVESAELADLLGASKDLIDAISVPENLQTITMQNCVRPWGTQLGQSVRFPRLENMSESWTSVSSSKENIVISSSSSSRSERVSTSRSEVGTSYPQLLQPSSSETLPPSSSQPSQPSTSQPSHSLPAKNALGDVKDQAEDEANPKPWYTAMRSQEYPLPDGWYARLPGLQEPANYATKFETGIYEEQVKSGYRFPLHPFALCFFEHYHMAPGQLVPNGWRKLVGLIYLVQTSGYKPDATDFMRVFFKICFIKGVANCPGWYYIHSRQRLLKGGPKSNKEQQLEWVRIIPSKPIPVGALTPLPAPTISSTSSAESIPLGVLLCRDEWLKKRADDGLEIYKLGFAKAKEIFAECFPDIPLNDFVLPVVVSPSGETILPSEAGDGAASHLPGEGPSGDAPEL
ncbi:hypothetical protein RJ639_010047 [Escallonia herrerae]|uniref:Transposase (putative) gypsy type domain-containing protein n=1 Tax=Escallonia herrerae TaxID=1293975 RepID=A0AA89AT41_9ASTE|nr:hypothetical protein RJ639_010047 [Escallonia herrerae]